MADFRIVATLFFYPLYHLPTYARARVCVYVKPRFMLGRERTSVLLGVVDFASSVSISLCPVGGSVNTESADPYC